MPAAEVSMRDADSVDLLCEEHRNPFEKALRRILNTELAEHTYAEILDGLPTNDSYRDLYYPREGHPSLQHLKLCPGVRERAREFRSSFDITALKFRSSLLSAFQQTIPGTRPFHLRLFELLAVSCHQIAAYLFQLDNAIHPHEEYVAWANEPRDMKQWDAFRGPTAFSFGSYIAIEQYPNGVADAVGYWAEARIFGGVVVFDRGDSETECLDVFIDRCGLRGPRTIYPLTTEQFNNLVSFLLDDTDENEQIECPLPLLATRDNRWRWDPWDAFARFHIFRDRHERKIPPEKPVQHRRFPHDWPELGDELFLLNAMCEQQEGLPVDEEQVAAARETIKQITPSSPLWTEKRTGEASSPGY